MSEKKYLISEEKEELIYVLNEVINFHSNKKLFNKEEKYILPFDCLLDLPLISVYDNEELKKKYPSGLVTENLILIPDTFVEKIYSTVSKHLFANRVLNEFMSAFVEHNLNIEFTDDEKKEIETSSISLNKFNSNEEFNLVKPEKVTNRELLNFIKNKNFSVEDLLNNVKSIENDIKENLENNKENFIKLPTLTKKLNKIKTSKINENITLEEFEDVVYKAKMMEISPNIPLKIINKKIEKELKDVNNNINDFINNLNDELIDYINSLNDLHYRKIINFFGSELKTDDMKLKRELAEKISSNKLFTLNKREILIDTLSLFDKFDKEFRFNRIKM